MITRGSFVHKPMVKFLGASPPPPFCPTKFLKILMVSDKTIHMAIRINKTLYKQNPLEKIFIFTVYQNYSLALTLSWPISLHSHKPPGPHCFEPFTCNVYQSFQPQNMHMCKQFLGKVSTAKMFFENQTYLWFVWFFLQNENELKIKEIFLPWKAKHTGKIVAP